MNTRTQKPKLVYCLTKADYFAQKTKGAQEGSISPNDLKRIYQAKTEEETLAQLEIFEETWNDDYPQIAKSWRSN